MSNFHESQAERRISPSPEPPPHSLTYQALLRAGPHLKLLLQVHAQIVISGTHRSRAVLTKLITSVCASGSISYVRKLFFSFPYPDAFLFSSLIRAAVKHGFAQDALFFYRRMVSSNIILSNYTFTSAIKACAGLSSLRQGRIVHSHAFAFGYGTNAFVQAALVAFYSKSGDLEMARKVFAKMPERTIVAWNSMISGYEQNGFGKDAIALFRRMQNLGIEPDQATFASVLSACAQLGDVDLGRWVHDYIATSGVKVNTVLGTSLINMYARCGNVSTAREVFEGMDDRNVVAWTAMISGYAMHGFGREAMDIFHQMRSCGQVPNYVTFIAVLSACAHAGLVQEGRQAFSSMKKDYNLVPGVEHHVCMVDMLGRAGIMNEAFGYIQQLDATERAPALWTAMLGACKIHKNFDLGVQVAEKLLAAEPEYPGHYVLLSNIYAMAGRMDRVEMVRNKMIRDGLKKQLGYSTIQIGQKTYLFSMGDKSHQETTKIYGYLEELMWKINEAGYVPVAESVMHDLEEEEKEYALRYHSEKLAVAFGLMKVGHGEAIRVVKNLRMCEDCHLAIKLISVVADREIIVRDKLRFHHFKGGSCSCLDYW